MTRVTGARSGQAEAPPLAQTMERAMQHQREGDLARAEQLYGEVLAREPSHPLALHLFGALLLQTGRDEGAVALLEDAVVRLPQQAVLFANLGEGYRRRGANAKARASLERAVALKPDLAEAHYTLGLTMIADNHGDEAILCFDRAAKLKSSLLPAYVGLSEALVAAGRIDEAGEAAERCLALDPTFADAHNRLAIVRRHQGRIEDALAEFRHALELRPDHRDARGNLVYSLPWCPGVAAASIVLEARRWQQQQLGGAVPDRSPNINERSPDRRLRVGFVPVDPRHHFSALSLVPLLEHRDRALIEVFSYSAVEAGDPSATRLLELSDHFRDISRANDADAVAMIRSDRIDILVGLSMHVVGSRPEVLARKAAPVQVAWLECPGTTGLSAMDYRLTDPWLDPPGTDRADYSEVSIHLPDTLWCYEPPIRISEPGPLPASRTGHVTFGCLNGFGKTNAGVLAAWAQVLAAVPGSRMLVLAPPGESRARALEAFARAGVDEGRIDFVAGGPRDEYLATYLRVDVALDTFPYNGQGASLDALWMGVPVVTLAGGTVVGRAGLAFAHHLDLQDLVAKSPEEYVSIAAALARDTSRLQVLRAELRARMERSPLMDGPRFARAFVDALRGTWVRWCEEPPRYSAEELASHAATLVAQGKDDEAEQAVHRALELDPRCAGALCNLGAILGKTDRYDEALACFDRAIEAEPDLAEAHLDRGNALIKCGLLEDAFASYRRAVELRPRSPAFRSHIVFHAHFHPGYSPRAIHEEALAWGRAHAAPLAPRRPRHANDRSPDRRLRIGYVSPDFRLHCQAMFMLPLLAHHDRGQFEIVCYSDVPRPDEWTGQIFSRVDHVRNIVGASDEQVAELVRADRVDILVDLTMHMLKNRLLVFARKPAPVQVTWLAYPGTTGVEAIDYRITDPVLDPPENERQEKEFYAERSLRLPDTFWCYHPLTSDRGPTALPFHTHGHIRFACLNAAYKLNDDVITTFARVLEAVPGSRLVLLAPSGPGRRRIAAAFAARGIADERVDFVDRQARLPYLATYRTIDICLDTFPYNGHTTSLDALWMGVPVVTLVGETVVGRAGLDISMALNLPELVARSKDEYVTIASNLAGDVERLAALRASLRDRIERSSLMDAPRFARNLEAAYRQVWRRWCTGGR